MLVWWWAEDLISFSFLFVCTECAAIRVACNVGKVHCAGGLA